MCMGKGQFYEYFSHLKSSFHRHRLGARRECSAQNVAVAKTFNERLLLKVLELRREYELAE